MDIVLCCEIVYCKQLHGQKWQTATCTDANYFGSSFGKWAADATGYDRSRFESAYQEIDQGFSFQLVISRKSYKETIGSVSYTHLTLPTKLEV